MQGFWKESKMKNNTPEEILDKIKGSKKIFIKLHDGPDGDSLGCCVAMKYFLERDFNIEVTLISPDALPEYLNLFEFNKEVEFGKEVSDFNLNDFDVLLSLDSGSMASWKKNSLKIPKGNLINIDHHPSNIFYGDLNYISNRPSTCSILIDLFKVWGVKFDKELSTRLLLGVYTDSGEFSFDNGESLRDAVFLLDNGANYFEGVVSKIKYNDSLNNRKYLAKMVNNFKIIEFEEHKVGVSLISKEEIKNLNLNLSEIRGGANYLQEIGGVDFLFTLIEFGNLLKGSFRSRKNIDVLRFSKDLGGGGHRFASAFRLEKMPLGEAEKKVFKTIKKVGIHKVK